MIESVRPRAAAMALVFLLCPRVQAQVKFIPASQAPLSGAGAVGASAPVSGAANALPSSAAAILASSLPTSFARALETASTPKAAAAAAARAAPAPQASLESASAPRTRTDAAALLIGRTGSRTSVEGSSPSDDSAVAAAREISADAGADVIFDGGASRAPSSGPVFAPKPGLLASALARPRTGKKGIAGVAGVVAVLGLTPPALALHGYGVGALVAFARAPTRLAELNNLAPMWGLPFSPWILAAAAVAVTLADLGLNILSHRLSPARMAGSGVPRPRTWVGIIASQVVTATFEEFWHRGGVFMFAFLLGAVWLGPAAAFALAALGEALYFSLSHGYGGVWSRVFGAMLYSGVFFLSGTIWLPIAAHFLHNMIVYLLAARTPPAERGEASEDLIGRLILDPRAPGAPIAAEAMGREHHYIEGTLDPATGAVLSARSREYGYGWKPSPGSTSFLLDLEPDPNDSFGMKPIEIEPAPASLKRADRRLRVHFGLRAPSFFASLFP